ncbi:MAG: Peptidoglycan-binding domain 1 protein [Parcubacteria group bacterium GW2011_GWC1_42_11]|uniref:Peptidoglycan-binding domain 1 protein n=1 Tax=Candidatus Nomurabacteria bacterium GW2011_GWC2_42_20 TaxID=1618756 RepID=A0A0G1CCI3_9BACT|nr:MAG: Peptidoglycan-binding domain 1 protein [Parcubacteria group bacterium GW2011_GWC1_42_11]KKS47353.1 MAG: Peptidoglycan-binding domain 1 protein [Candidatus Nomurabacteria bacterium GW2011_GWC2_42_20]KKT07659.1 MAG: Peptidoglycan-binding domain 1 protein [Candidatus Nomurabacteria bacterium GW2011_GWB1_43_20]HBH71564.1 hypothetical protein [Candidatus Yonathbacteria bacterium]
MKKKQEHQSEKKLSVIYIAIFLVVLGATNVGTYFFMSRVENGVAVLSFSMLNPARAFIKQKDLIVNFQPLRDYLNEKYEMDPNVSIYFEYLPTGSNIAISKDTEFYPASLLKLPVAIAVAKKIENGEWKWANELVLMPADKDDGFGDLYKEPSNSAHSIEELVRRSLSDSDNTAHFILTRNLEIEEIEDVYNHMGLDGFLTGKGNLSAKRYSVILRSVYNASYLSEGSSQKLLSYLSKSSFKDYIQSGLPEDITFAHKIGISDEENVFLDSGIVYAKDRPYILTVMTKNKDEQIAQKMMADISRKVYNYISEYEE